MEDSVIVENKPAASGADHSNEVEVVTSILSQLSKIEAPTRERILQTVATFYGISLRAAALPSKPYSGAAAAAGSHSRKIVPFHRSNS